MSEYSPKDVQPKSCRSFNHAPSVWHPVRVLDDRHVLVAPRAEPIKQVEKTFRRRVRREKGVPWGALFLCAVHDSQISSVPRLGAVERLRKSCVSGAAPSICFSALSSFAAAASSPS